MAALLLSSCAVEIKNERWFGDLGPRGAVWFESLTDQSGQVSKEDWDKMRVGMACVTTDTLAEIKAEIEKLCSAETCDYEKVQNALGKFQRDVNDLNQRIP